MVRDHAVLCTFVWIGWMLVGGGCRSEWGPIADDIMAPLGEPLPFATEDQLEAFERGKAIAEHRFELREGLGPAFNVVSCAACHERPVVGGSAGRYRNFFVYANVDDEGFYTPSPSAGLTVGGIQRIYYYGDDEDIDAHPAVDPRANVFAMRNPIGLFGAGLMSEISDREILRRADPEDRDHDGISGRPNYDRGFVGHFGRKAQISVPALEGFIRAPMFNHAGITSYPLPEIYRRELPFPISEHTAEAESAWIDWIFGHAAWAQVAVGDIPLIDVDDVLDPELSSTELFDLVSFATLLAAPVQEELTEAGERGRRIFDELRCVACHVPRMRGPRGNLPLYSDLLLHDMGDELADGLQQGREASGREFRTQPLWGLAAVGPYLHDGRASTVEEAIDAHGGEAEEIREEWQTLDESERRDLLEFLMSLGGRDQYTPGLLPVGEPLPPVGDYGGPVRALNEGEEAAFEAGRAFFDRDFQVSEGMGGPRFDGDSCRACHFQPVIGGAGPRDVNVIRHGILNGEGEFTVPEVGTVFHRSTTLLGDGLVPQPDANVFEMRQTPPLFGLGLIESIADEDILANADPEDLDGDGISGKPSWTDGERLGRFGWKAQIPSIHEFVRDAFTTEFGMTVPYAEGQTFGALQDNDDVEDPEASQAEIASIETYLRLLAPPPRQVATSSAQVEHGEELFAGVGCAACHVPVLQGEDGPVPLYSDLLLHEILPEGSVGIEEFSATILEFRTAPLWGVSQTAPYLHSGKADTLLEAIEAHDGEAAGVREAFFELDGSERADVLAFLETL